MYCWEALRKLAFDVMLHTERVHRSSRKIPHNESLAPRLLKPDAKLPLFRFPLEALFSLCVAATMLLPEIEERTTIL